MPLFVRKSLLTAVTSALREQFLIETRLFTAATVATGKGEKTRTAYYDHDQRLTALCQRVEKAMRDDGYRPPADLRGQVLRLLGVR